MRQLFSNYNTVLKSSVVMGFLVAAAVFLSNSYITLAQTSTQTSAQQQHVTLIINQVRGGECCSPGGISELEGQLATATRLGLPTTFTVRFDALESASHAAVLKKAQQQGHEVGAFLEITPSLAQASSVHYQGTPENWWEAQHVYLVGYSPKEREALIDTYMKKYKQVFGTYPKTTTAWIIDPWSLRHLKWKYGVQVHQITREQWGTDSYTLWGGPPHVPYYPSENWALIPTATPSAALPLIVRQTIADPVNNYGDRSNSFTSQPNDYGIASRGTDYFKHLFTQAHSQPTQPTTFALIGLENSMPSKDQEEFVRQLEFVAEWKKLSPQNKVLTASEIEQQKLFSPTKIEVMSGTDFSLGSSRQAWYVTTPYYRARLRLDGGELALTDVRLYHTGFVDPYLDGEAERLSYWVVPYVLDASQYRSGPGLGLTFDRPHQDVFVQDTLTRVILKSGIDPAQLQASMQGDTWQLQYQGQTVFSAKERSFVLPADRTEHLQSVTFQQVVSNWQWRDTQGTVLWGAQNPPAQPITQEAWEFQPQVFSTELTTEREQRYPYLFPELVEREVSATYSAFTASNEYAMAGRNPVRIIFRPKDKYNFQTFLETKPEIVHTGTDVQVEISTQHPGSGEIFVDLFSSTPQWIDVTVKVGEYTSTTDVVFAANCKQRWFFCLTRPWHIYWWVRNWWQDRQRFSQAQVLDLSLWVALRRQEEAAS